MRIIQKQKKTIGSNPTQRRLVLGESKTAPSVISSWRYGEPFWISLIHFNQLRDLDVMTVFFGKLRDDISKESDDAPPTDSPPINCWAIFAGEQKCSENIDTKYCTGA